jgi:NAD(P)-dependent dehydrogenase (short-subunit alcohol dehydrogenase family)
VTGLRDAVALVTGGSRGLGFLVARELGRAGASVVICGRDPAALQRARATLARDADVHAVPCDVTDRAAVDGLVRETLARFGRLDVLVNNAGVMDVGPVETMAVEDFRRALDVMFWGVLYPTLAVLPHMRARGTGRIVNVTSIGGKVSVPHLLPYACAKFAAVGLSEGLGAELAGTGVRVVTIVPGLMRTGSYVNAFFRGRREREYRWFSLGASLPLVSMDAERAARQIVRATVRGDAERILSLPAQLAARFHGLFPVATVALLAAVNRLVLPRAGGADGARTRGADVQRRVTSPLFLAATGLGLAAVRRFQEHAAVTSARRRRAPARAAAGA